MTTIADYSSLQTDHTGGDRKETFQTLREMGGVVGSSFALACVLLGAEMLLSTYAPWLAMLALLPLAGVLSWACYLLALRLPSRTDADKYEPLIAREAEWQNLMAQYLPSLRAQKQEILETNKHAEQAVMQVCESFHAMAARARESVAQATKCLGGGGDGQDDRGASVDKLVETTRKTMQNLLSSIVHASTSSMKMVYEMEDVEEGMKKIIASVRGVEAIARHTKLLALNTTIEAARVGEQGKGFAVVAAEITKLAEHATTESEGIRKLVSKVSADIDSAHADLQLLASSDMSDAALVQEEVDRTMVTLTETNEEMRRSVVNSAQRSEDLARDISKVVIAMQFQDMVSQRNAHTVKAMDEIEAALSACAEEGEYGTMKDCTDQPEHVAPIGNEQQALKRAAEAGAKIGSNDWEDNIELF